jgi:quercetin dioxygenase-like cupin family protein
MSIPYKIHFDQIEWETPVAGVRHKYIDHAGQRIRLVEYSKDLSPHWCEKGHCGYLISGAMEIEYDHATITYNQGDGIYIPEGSSHKHRGRVLTDIALVFFIEKI